MGFGDDLTDKIQVLRSGPFLRFYFDKKYVNVTGDRVLVLNSAGSGYITLEESLRRVKHGARK
jgi:hypothetical protein